jgi:hypothetical protein
MGRACGAVAGDDRSAPQVNRRRRGHASFVIAMTIPASTKTTIAICIQIQVGDIVRYRSIRQGPANRRGDRPYTTIVRVCAYRHPGRP